MPHPHRTLRRRSARSPVTPARPAAAGLAVAALLLAACGERPEPLPDRPATPEVPADVVPPAEDRPATRTDTILIEGMPEPMEMRLVHAPTGFPLPFSAYVPADMEPVIQRLPGDRASARFVAVFGGVRQERAFLDVEIHGAGTTPAEARRDAEAYAAERRGMVRRVETGQQGDRVFRLTIEYPAEYGDGMAPRTAAIMESWRWADGSPLRTTR